MVTMDNAIRNVGEFNGDLEAGKQDYETAKQGLKLAQERLGSLEEAICEETGFDEFNMPQGIVKTVIPVGDVVFTVKSTERTKRPAYKGVVDEMKQYISTVHRLCSGGRAITGVVKDGREYFMRADKLLEEFDIMLYAALLPEIRQDISFDTSTDMMKEKPHTSVMLRQGVNPAELTAENAVDYVRISKIIPALEKFKKAYEAKLSPKDKEEKEIVPVTSELGYAVLKKTSKGPNWAYIVKTMLKVPTDDKSYGELNRLADPEMMFEEKTEAFPQYRLLEHIRQGESVTYISLQSVYGRIRELEGRKKVVSERMSVESKPIV